MTAISCTIGGKNQIFRSSAHRSQSAVLKIHWRPYDRKHDLNDNDSGHENHHNQDKNNSSDRNRDDNNGNNKNTNKDTTIRRRTIVTTTMMIIPTATTIGAGITIRMKIAAKGPTAIRIMAIPRSITTSTIAIAAKKLTIRIITRRTTTPGIIATTIGMSIRAMAKATTAIRTQ
jgi:hypothetical protein